MSHASVKIRLAYHGCTNRPFYHIVVAASKFKRNGRHIEQVGSIDPMANYNNEKLVGLNVERIKYWLGVGATPTLPVYRILGLAGILPVHPRTYKDIKKRRQELMEETRTESDDNINIIDTKNENDENDN